MESEHVISGERKIPLSRISATVRCLSVTHEPNLVPLLLRFDGDELTTDERIRTLAQRWQPSRSLRLDEQSAKAVDTDMIILPCLVGLPAPAPARREKPRPP